MIGAIDRLYMEVESAAAQRGTEGLSVIVLTADRDQAAALGPLVAARLHPDRRIGAVLHVEPIDAMSSEVIVEVGRGRSFANVRVGRP